MKHSLPHCQPDYHEKLQNLLNSSSTQEYRDENNKRFYLKNYVQSRNGIKKWRFIRIFVFIIILIV